ncbi:MAG TPA: hypothetical protein VMT49_06410 [Steroidobacteraceae bacterium]|nr:hypothetical protein [Steroidobacteraceae bacterium]
MTASKARRTLLQATAVAALLVATALATVALQPIHAPTREQLFEIPRGTWARRMAGARVEILPAELHLTLGVRDILVLHNLDDVPQQFGPILLMPGQTFRMPFTMAASYPFACTAHLSGQMSIVVEPNPATPWARLAWRFSNYLRSGRWS